MSHSTTLDEVRKLLTSWWMESWGGIEEEVEEMLEDITEEVIEQINLRMATEDESKPDAIYNELAEQGILEDNQGMHDSFVDFCEVGNG